MVKFQSYQFMQINPDDGDKLFALIGGAPVSIVSIHADQSRPVKINNKEEEIDYVSIVSIHADQSRPVVDRQTLKQLIQVSIVSIHADQSRPVNI